MRHLTTTSLMLQFTWWIQRGNIKTTLHFSYNSQHVLLSNNDSVKLPIKRISLRWIFWNWNFQLPTFVWKTQRPVAPRMTMSDCQLRECHSHECFATGNFIYPLWFRRHCSLLCGTIELLQTDVLYCNNGVSWPQCQDNTLSLYHIKGCYPTKIWLTLTVPDVT